ncbi:probable ATP-dependent RNA helicase DDX49 isoform X1 [Hydra vulgaris]|uniref:probable ATP-dependent RNA helicase DDX49 isoform X1 n=1 Tax=Hydra vulgaris TaxID=6087 RepID=UPI0002B45E52|nr:probable ATP-dependent RNA helicase DDX49 [Hydra vulgaris]
MATKFTDLGLHEWLNKQCLEMGISKPTEIQVSCIPEILSGRDCIGSAKTGSGKTAAFALPIIQKLSEDPYGIFALILTPTRELAIQIADQFKALGKSIGLNDAVIIGGLDMVKQGMELSNQPHVVIATPGRLASHITSGTKFSLNKIKFLVLDEADRLLEKSFENDLEVIFDNIAKKRQTLLFSATITDAINHLKEVAHNPFCYEVKSDFATVTELDQRYLLIPSQVKDCYLVHLLQNFSEKSVIIFTQTCRSCQVISFMLRKVEFKCAGLHSVMSQRERLSSLGRFRSGHVKILVATDVASRGLDIPLVQLVINYNVPASPKDYVHRVGRTARAGRGGMSLTLLTQFDIDRLKAIETFIGLKMKEFETNEDDAVKLLKPISIIRREVEIRLNDANFGEKKKNNKRKLGLLNSNSKPKLFNKKKITDVT